MTGNFILSRYKCFEIQIEWRQKHLEIEWFTFLIQTRSYGDHKGVNFRFELMKSLFLEITIYDIRHEHDD